MKNIMIVKSEEDEKAVIEMIRKSKGKKLLVSIHSLEDDDTPCDFVPRHKNECIDMIKMAETVAAILDEVTGMKKDLKSLRNCFNNVSQLKLYTEAQKDLKNLVCKGYEGTILFPPEE